MAKKKVIDPEVRKKEMLEQESKDMREKMALKV
jgi:hypothetical protein